MYKQNICHSSTATITATSVPNLTAFGLTRPIVSHQEFIIEERGEYPTLHICCRPSLARVRDLSALFIHICETAFAREN